MIKRRRGGVRGPEPVTRGKTIRSARIYDFGYSMLFGLDRRLWSMVIDLARVRPGQIVLDTGCGTGRLAFALAAVVGPQGEVHGIDAAPEMIRFARRKAERGRIKAGFQVAPIEDLPFNDEMFDMVMNTLVMHHLPDETKRTGLREVHRVLRPGGAFLAVDVQVPDAGWTSSAARLLLGRHMADSDITNSLDPLRLAGFVDVEAGPTPNNWFAFARGLKEAASRDRPQE